MVSKFNGHYQVQILGQPVDVLNLEGLITPQSADEEKYARARLHVAMVTVQPIKMEVSLDPSVLEFISAALRTGKGARLDIIIADFDSEYLFTASDCMLKEVEFPARDWKKSKSRRGVILTVQPVTLNVSRDNLPKPHRSSQWIGNYRLQMDTDVLGPGGADAYAAFVWKRGLTVFARSGYSRLPKYKAMTADRPIFQIEVPLSRAKGLEEWFQETVDRGSRNALKMAGLSVQKTSGNWDNICDFDLGQLELLGLTKTPIAMVADIGCDYFRPNF